MTKEYSIACTEVLEILKHLPKYQQEKIPKSEIDFYEENKDRGYNFRFDTSKSFNEQQISNMANAIIITIFRDYFANEQQKSVLKSIINENNRKIEYQKRLKYNPDRIFENTEKNTDIQIIEVSENKSFFRKICEKIKIYLNKKK